MFDVKTVFFLVYDRMRCAMINLVKMLMPLLAVVCFAGAEPPYREAHAVMAQKDKLLGTNILTHGVVDSLEKDGASNVTFFMKLEGGLYCRVQRSVFNEAKGASAKFKSASGTTELKLERYEKLLLVSGTDVIVRGVLKKDMKRWILDKANILGCSEYLTRNVLSSKCYGKAQSCLSYCTVCGSGLPAGVVRFDEGPLLKLEPKTELKPEPAPELIREPKPEPVPKPKPVPAKPPIPELKPEPELIREPQPLPEPKPKPEPVQQHILLKGYTLLYNGRKVSGDDAAGFSRERAVQNLNWNRKNKPHLNVEGYFDGEKLP